MLRFTRGNVSNWMDTSKWGTGEGGLGIDIEIPREIGPREDFLHRDKSRDLRVTPPPPLPLSNGLSDTMRSIIFPGQCQSKERRKGFHV